MSSQPKKYSVHKIFGPTIQGEGGMSGVVSHFIRLSGCNMWDGRPETREASQCPFCDTDFLSHTMMTADEILQALLLQTMDNRAAHGLTRPKSLDDWRELSSEWVTISGGEPLLQIDWELCETLAIGFKIAVETNGTVEMNPRLLRWVDYITMSPKVPRDEIQLSSADCLKVLHPHPNPEITPQAFAGYNAEEFFVQPIDAGNPEDNLKNLNSSVQTLYQLGDPWRLSLQIHKILDVE